MGSNQLNNNTELRYHGEQGRENERIIEQLKQIDACISEQLILINENPRKKSLLLALGLYQHHKELFLTLLNQPTQSPV